MRKVKSSAPKGGVNLTKITLHAQNPIPDNYEKLKKENQKRRKKFSGKINTWEFGQKTFDDLFHFVGKTKMNKEKEWQIFANERCYFRASVIEEVFHKKVFAKSMQNKLMIWCALETWGPSASNDVSTSITGQILKNLGWLEYPKILQNRRIFYTSDTPKCLKIDWFRTNILDVQANPGLSIFVL